MNHDEFERFVLTYGCDLLRFCRMTAGDKEAGDELYQDTMLKLTEKRGGLDAGQNTKSYAISIAIFLWKNRRRKYAIRNSRISFYSMEALEESGWECADEEKSVSPEDALFHQSELRDIRRVVAELPEKYRFPIYLFYSAGLQIAEIAKILHVPEGTVKTRLRKAKKLLKKELEALGYDG